MDYNETRLPTEHELRNGAAEEQRSTVSRFCAAMKRLHEPRNPTDREFPGLRMEDVAVHLRAAEAMPLELEVMHWITVRERRYVERIEELERKVSSLWLELRA